MGSKSFPLTNDFPSYTQAYAQCQKLEPSSRLTRAQYFIFVSNYYNKIVISKSVFNFVTFQIDKSMITALGLCKLNSNSFQIFLHWFIFFLSIYANVP